MTRIILEPEVRQKLLNLKQPLELCDDSGKVLARVLPVLDHSEYYDLDPKISKEEFRRRIQNKGKTYTTAEVLARLEKL